MLSFHPFSPSIFIHHSFHVFLPMSPFIHPPLVLFIHCSLHSSTFPSIHSFTFSFILFILHSFFFFLHSSIFPYMHPLHSFVSSSIHPSFLPLIHFSFPSSFFPYTHPPLPSFIHFFLHSSTSSLHSSTFPPFIHSLLPSFIHFPIHPPLPPSIHPFLLSFIRLSLPSSISLSLSIPSSLHSPMLESFAAQSWMYFPSLLTQLDIASSFPLFPQSLFSLSLPPPLFLSLFLFLFYSVHPFSSSYLSLSLLRFYICFCQYIVFVATMYMSLLHLFHSFTTTLFLNYFSNLSLSLNLNISHLMWFDSVCFCQYIVFVSTMYSVTYLYFIILCSIRLLLYLSTSFLSLISFISCDCMYLTFWGFDSVSTVGC